MANTINKANKEYMNRGFPELYQRIYGKDARIDLEKESVSKVDCLTTELGEDALVLYDQSGMAYRMNSAYSPETEAKIWADGQYTAAANLLVFGLGNGVCAKEIVKRRLKKSRILIYEPSARVFLYALEHFDLTFCFAEPGIRVIVNGINEDMFGNVMEEMLTLENREDYEFIFCPQMAKVFPKEREWLIQRYASDGIGRTLTVRNTVRWTIHISPYNLLHNLLYLKNNTVVPKLAKVWDKNAPIVIVGAGPSLEKELDVLRDIKKKAFFFAVDSALPFLMEHDIIPDAFFCAEADKPMNFFEDSRVADIPMFGKLETTHKLMDIHKAFKIFGYENGFSEMFYQMYNVPQSCYRYGANCATSLFAISKELGAKTVILAGQDMVYSESGASHVGNREQGDYFKGEVFTCMNNEGREVETRYDWFTFLRWYENAVLTCKFEHVINTSLKGAKIKGAEVMPLQEAVEKYGREHTDFQTILKKAELTFGTTAFDEMDFYSKCKAELEKVCKIIKENPKDERRKQYLIYQILKLYEIADEEENFEISQKKGLDKIREYLDMCIIEAERIQK